MILLTGGSGRLGQGLKSLVGIIAPSHKDLDITKDIKPLPNVNLIIHCAAYTDVERAEANQHTCYTVNTLGTLNLLKAYPDVPFVFISSEYAKYPINTYAISKYLAELLVKDLSFRYLIIRTLFKDKPFPHSKAFTDQYTQGDYVDVITKLILNSITNWNFKNKVEYVGTGRKTIYDLAKQTRPEITGISVDSITKVKLPKDYL